MSNGSPVADPATARVLAMIAASGAPSMARLSPEAARAAMLAAGETADIAPPDVASVIDRTIPGAARNMRIRVYNPDPQPSSPQPVTLFFHGGGFVIGDLDTHDNIARSIAICANAILVAVDYALAPEHPFPAAYDDAAAAFDWLIASGAEINADTNRIAVAGDSAGGSLTISVARLARDRGHRLAAQALLYPVCDLTRTYPSETAFAEVPPISTDVLNYFWGHFLGDDRGPELYADLRLSPLNDPETEGLPPAFVMTAGLDPLRDEGIAYASKLAAAGIETQTLMVTGTIHGFLRMGRLIPSVGDTLVAAGTFLGRHLRAENA